MRKFFLLASLFIPNKPVLFGLLTLSLITQGWGQNFSAFPYGVASGDPYSESVVLWTAIHPTQSVETLVWECTSDSTFHYIDISGIAMTTANSGGTVKVIARGLQASTHYYYRFWWNESTSPVGRTKTAPPPNAMEPIKLGVVSCANYEAGFFHAYKALAAQEGLDAVVHLGDYLYEYAPIKAKWTLAERKHIPNHELLSIEDYRLRYAQYHQDPDLQALHAAHPIIAIWDDHEIANNSYQSGAQNHQAEEGAYLDRAKAAMQAYREWMPIREDQPQGYRVLRFGQMVDLILLETRLDGRTAQPKKNEDRFQPEEVHHMMSPHQRDWLLGSLEQSQAAYRVICNQVIFSPLNLGVLPSKKVASYNLDAWDGYAKERDLLSSYFATSAPVVILTGDSHCAWAFQNKGYVELCVQSITSPNFNEFAQPLIARLAGFLLKWENHNLEFVNTRDHGFMLVEFGQAYVESTWVFMDEIKQKAGGQIQHKRKRRFVPWTKNALRRAPFALGPL